MQVSKDSSIATGIYLQEAEKNYKAFKNEDNQKLIIEVKNGNIKALNKLIKKNQLFIVKFALKYVNQGVEFLDLISAGNEGMLEATRRYDPNSLAKFTTYSVYWIKCKILNEIACKSRLVRIPSDRNEACAKIHRFMQEYTNKNGFAPTPEIAASKLNMKLSTVKLLMDLERPVKLHDYMTDGHNIDEEFDKHFIKNFIDKVMDDKLTQREKIVIERRYGMSNYAKANLNELGDHLGVSREYVRQLQIKALKILKRHLSLEKNSQFRTDHCKF